VTTTGCVSGDYAGKVKLGPSSLIHPRRSVRAPARRRLVQEEDGQMADRLVTGTGKDDSGDITSLCGVWGERTKTEAILDIEIGLHRYYTSGPGGTEADVVVVNGDSGKYVRTEPDLSKADDLQSLPDC